MEEIRKIILSLIILSLMSVGWSSVYLEIQHIDTEASTLNIFMENLPSCSYCINPDGNNNDQPPGHWNWKDQQQLCESFLESTWIINHEMNASECSDIESIDGAGGFWFNGEVAAFQFQMIGMTVEENAAFGGSSQNAGLTVLTMSLSDSTANVLGFSVEVYTIPTGAEILTNITFASIADEICFAPDGFPGMYVMVVDNEGNSVPHFTGGCINVDDGYVDGCTYETATNYNPDATFDDGSCEFMWGDVDHDGVLTIQDLILIVNEILNF